MEIRNQVALVTGAGSGLGAETARVLSEHGARVAVLDRDSRSANGIAAEIAVQHVVESLGAPRILVNCAGIGGASRVLRREGPMRLEELQRIVRVTSRCNSRGKFRCNSTAWDECEAAAGRYPAAENAALNLRTRCGEYSCYSREKLPPDRVRSSIARRLGLDVAGLVPADRNVDGVVEMMVDATSQYQEPLTTERLFAWHAALFPTGRSGMRRINVGAWRQDESGSMQVVSGPMGKETVHYEAPPAERVPDEMTQFLEWFGDPGDTDPLLAACQARSELSAIITTTTSNGPSRAGSTSQPGRPGSLSAFSARSPVLERYLLRRCVKTPVVAGAPAIRLR